MSLKLNVSKWMAVAALSGLLPWQASAQSAIAPQGAEYPIAAPLPGDQVKPHLAINSAGGFLVWQDNVTDGAGLGISAQRLNGVLSPTMGTFRVNQIGANDQENPQVALLQQGGAVFVWQGGKQGYQKIYSRFMKAQGTFATGDILVSAATNLQVNPVVTSLTDGSVLVAWSSFGQDGDLQGVFARRFSSTGSPLGNEFQVNQTTLNNQRAPAIAALANGGFVVAWVSEAFLGVYNNGGEKYGVDIFGRLYNAQATVLNNEFKVSTDTNVCANPALAALPTGGFAVAWSQSFGTTVTDGVVSSNGWDIVTRSFDAAGRPTLPVSVVNTTRYGDQYVPKISGLDSGALVVWTSMQQDGSWEGVYGRLLTSDGKPVGDEIQINTTTVSRQIFPTVASDGNGRYLVAWSSFVGGASSFDLFAQRYSSAQSLPKLAPPVVSALSQSRLSVAWPAAAGLAVDHYELFLDDSTTPLMVTNDFFVVGQLAPSTTHAIRLVCQLQDGSRSPMSDPGTATTWGEDLNGDGLPDDWQASYWGADASQWPASNVDSDGDGATNFQEFLAGTSPIDPLSVLRTSLDQTSQGWRLNWNTQPGFIYQVQTTSNLTSWISLGAPRFAAGTNDSLAVDGSGGLSYYRVIRLR